GHAEIAGRGTLMNRVQDAGPEPAPARIVRFDVERASTELENALQHLDGIAKAGSAGERPVEADAAPPWIAGKFHARKLFADANLQVGKSLVVLELDIEPRLDVLDEPGFEEQGIHFAGGLEEVDIGDELDQVRRARFLGGRFGEVVRGAIT